MALSPLLPIVWLPFALLPAVLGGMAMHLSLAALGLRGARAYALAGAPAGFALAAMLYACFGAGGWRVWEAPKPWCLVWSWGLPLASAALSPSGLCCVPTWSKPDPRSAVASA